MLVLELVRGRATVEMELNTSGVLGSVSIGGLDFVRACTVVFHPFVVELLFVAAANCPMRLLGESCFVVRKNRFEYFDEVVASR